VDCHHGQVVGILPWMCIFLSTSDFVSYNPKDSILWIFLLDTLGILVQSTFLAPLFERTDFAVLSRADKITPSQLGGGYFEF